MNDERLWMTVDDALRIIGANSTRQDIERTLIANLPSNGGPRPPSTPLIQEIEREFVALGHLPAFIRRLQDLVRQAQRPPVRELAWGKRLGVMWHPRDCASWPFRAYCGSGHRFLKVGRLSFWIRWAYD